MCAVSFIADDWRNRYPSPFDVPVTKFPDWTEQIERARAKDKLEGLPDCSDGAKLKYLMELEARIKKLKADLELDRIIKAKERELKELENGEKQASPYTQEFLGAGFVGPAISSKEGS